MHKIKSICYTTLILALFLNCQKSTEQELSKAKQLFSEGNFSMAVPILEDITEQDENNADAWNMLGIAYYEMKNFEQAIFYFNKAIKLNNQNYKYFYNRANAQRELKLLLEAVEDYGQALTLEKNVADIYFNRAVVLMNLNRKKEAIADFEACIQHDSKFARAYFGLASAQISLEQSVSAESCQYLQKAFDLGYVEAKETIDVYCK